MKTTEQKIVFALRILISGLFFLSAFAKLYWPPLYGINKVFEQGQLIPMGLSETIAPFVSRFIIALELFLAITILLPYLVKRIIIPISFIMISVFSIHLSFQLFGGSKNCGCFGDLIPMTPLEALIKNIVTLFILFYIYKKMKMKKGSMSVLTILFLTILTLMFAFLPVSNQSKKGGSFMSYVEDKEFVDLEGDKILCLFDPDCHHCQQVARSLDSLSKLVDDFPDIHIIFSDINNDSIISQETKERIDVFFEFVGVEMSYQSIPFQDKNDTKEVDSYLEMTFPDYDNPVVIFYNGKDQYDYTSNLQIRLYEGIGSNKFNPEDLKMILRNR